MGLGLGLDYVVLQFFLPSFKLFLRFLDFLRFLMGLSWVLHGFPWAFMFFQSYFGILTVKNTDSVGCHDVNFYERIEIIMGL